MTLGARDDVLVMSAVKFILSLLAYSVPAALVALVSAHLAKASKDEWKLMAWVPVLPLAAWSVWISWDSTRDETSHNLWPFELVMVGALSLVLFAVVALARVLIGRESQKPGAWRHRRHKQ
jgi:hypothetical protein